jgi:hypothetical protein
MRVEDVMKSTIWIAVFAGVVSSVGCGGEIATYAPPVPTTGGSVWADQTAVAQTGHAKLSIRMEHVEPPSKLATALFLTAKDLDPPQQLAPDATVYMAWARSSDGELQALGPLAMDSDATGTLSTVAPFDHFTILVTPEPDVDGTRPTHDPVFVSEVTRGH